jgi:hypothetical protein
MFRRFAAACVVASIVIAAGSAISLLLRLPVEGAWLLTTAWCFVPAAWGLWAMLAPARWVPSRLPAWGAILGVVAGIMAGPVLNLPLRIGGPSVARWIAPVVGPILYFLLWLLVGVAYRSLHVPDQSPRAGCAGSLRDQ